MSLEIFLVLSTPELFNHGGESQGEFMIGWCVLLLQEEAGVALLEVNHTAGE